VKGLRVFLVEDEAMIRMMVVDMLEELGHSVSAEAGVSTGFTACAVGRL
jgi:CheY-like chemotaxis protein